MRSFDEEAPHSTARKEFVNLSDSELDQTFDLTALRSEVYGLIHNEGNKPWIIKERELLDANSDTRAEWIFATRLLASYGTSIPQVEHLLKSVPPPLILQMLSKKRTNLINQFAGTETGQHWMMCMKEQDGWKYVAQYAYGANSRLESSLLDKFMLALDQIAIIHDIIKGRGKKYGFDLNIVSTKSINATKQYCKHPENAHLILQLLHKRIDGQETPKRSSRPIRAALASGAFCERPSYTWFDNEFGNSCKNDSSSYYSYTDMEKNNPYEDKLYDEILNEFKTIS